VTCAVCGAGSFRRKLHTAGVDVHECLSCGLQFWEPPPGFRPRRTYDAAYFENASSGHGYDDYASLEGSLRRNFARRLAHLGRPAPGARLLDVGAAYGFAVSEACRAGWRAVGLEISSAAARRAAATTGGCVALADVSLAPFPAQLFDAVTMWDVIEHLPDPHRAVACVAALLKPGGRIVLTTGDAGSAMARLSGPRWHLYTIPEHLYFYTRRSLEMLLSSHGLRVEFVRAEASVYTLGYLAERLRKTLLKRSGRGVPHGPGANLEVPLNLFDVVTASAVRT
jgi:SAM-dependent methyltransferase